MFPYWVPSSPYDNRQAHQGKDRTRRGTLTRPLPLRFPHDMYRMAAVPPLRCFSLQMVSRLQVFSAFGIVPCAEITSAA